LNTSFPIHGKHLLLETVRIQTKWEGFWQQPFTPERPSSEHVSQKRQHRKNEGVNKMYLGSFSGEGCQASEAKEGSDHRKYGFAI
jgi:hypothetical protein